jgi:hypothetical protein
LADTAAMLFLPARSGRWLAKPRHNAIDQPIDLAA